MKYIDVVDSDTAKTSSIHKTCGESRVGKSIAAQASHRTVRDTLASYGSHCSAASEEQSPMSEELSLAARYALQPVDGSCLVPAQGLELPIGPSC